MTWLRRKVGGLLMYTGFYILPEPLKTGVSLISAAGLIWAEHDDNLLKALKLALTNGNTDQ